MSASASHSGSDSNVVKSEMESEDETCVTKTGTKTHVTKTIHVPTKAELQTGLKNWSASSGIKLNAGESEREYKHSEPPRWECIICSKLIKKTPVYQNFVYGRVFDGRSTFSATYMMPFIGDRSKSEVHFHDCQTGHLACSSCSQRGVNCRSCSRAVSRIRCLAVEKMINSLVVTCKFAKLGCDEVMEFGEFEKSKHEDNCSFMPMFCPMPGCKHAGVKNLLSQHLLSEHNISSLVDVGKLDRSYGLYTYSAGDSKEFDLDSATALVMLRNMRFQEFHLLHHQCTMMGDRLEITSLAETCKRKYELVVKVSEELTYCYKSVSTSNIQPVGGLLIPKQSNGVTPKKRCKVTMPEWS